MAGPKAPPLDPPLHILRAVPCTFLKVLLEIFFLLISCCD